MARCYGAHIVSPVSTADSPASTVSGVSAGGHIASSPAVETSPASSPSTLSTAFARLSAQPRLSPILKLSSQQKGRLSTVLECTETSDKGSGTTALWAHPEESLITNARQPSLIDGNFSCISPLSPSVAFGHEELSAVLVFKEEKRALFEEKCVVLAEDMTVTIISRRHRLAKSAGYADTINQLAELMEDIEKLKVCYVVLVGQQAAS
ncbi:uncharacterized protein LOC142784785 [Rhipicephalus microplus]|uniref:uncharacterized protein LOC142784785 n=1 Tax=Rhipicephalus microplus TaxID=6941 RepID=UPI003F6CF0EF